jgi:hypothetical protein
MAKNLQLIPLVDELVESIINGNVSYVVGQIAQLPKKQAMVVSAYVVERMPDESARSRFLLNLERLAGL